MRRWLAIALGVALVGAAAAWLVRGGRPPSATRVAPHAEIDDASRAKLEQILEQADRRDAPREPRR